jgi:four helix bundle protein
MTNDEGMLTNDEARMTRLRQATAWQANDEGMLINDEVQMTRLRQATAWQANDEGMTKSEAQKPGTADDSFWNEDAEWVIREEPEKKRVYDLEERTARFGEAIIDFARKIPRGPLTDRIISQLVGAVTSVGANYDEADDAVSKKEFLKCIGTCKKEARESKHFLRMAARAVPELRSEARELWLEARALHLIFAKIWRSGREK